MKTIPQHIRRWLAGILCAGVAGDLLLRVTPWGFNLVVWIVFLGVMFLLLVRKEQQPMSRAQRMCLFFALTFGVLQGWRDSSGLKFLNTFALFGSLGLAFWLAGSGRQFVAGLIHTCVRMLSGALLPLVGSFALINSWLANNAETTDEKAINWKRFLRMGIGLVITLPVLAVFGSLFASADAVFKQIILTLTDFNVERVTSHALYTVLFAWLAGGIFFWLWPQEKQQDFSEPASPQLLGNIEIGTMLTALNMLFLLFIGVQLSYLFGGDGWVQRTAHLSYAEYFRSGFFELLAVAALLIPLLLLCDWLWNREESPRRFHQLALALLVQLCIVMLSAWQRLTIYLQAYGLTEQRLYAAAVLCWLGFAAVWFAFTVLQGNRLRFAPGMAVAGFALILGLNVLNPDRLIASHQLDRMAAGRNWDFRYIVQLSADASPVLLEALDKFPESERRYVISRVVYHWSKNTEDWRTCNWSRWQAAQWKLTNAQLVNGIPDMPVNQSYANWEKADSRWGR